jgi:Domain of unknown function (DUF5666)
MKNTKLQFIQRCFISTGFIVVAALSACGGGGADIGSGGTGNTPPALTTTAATVIGPITGFGSVIINGVKFDDSSSSLVDDRNNSIAKDSLRLGMVVAVTGQVSDDKITAVANQMRLISELQGAVTQIDLAGGRIVVLGVTVTVSATTSYANVAGLAGLALNEIVEIHGLRDPSTQALIATRIERKNGLENNPFLVGQIRNLNNTSSSFLLGSIASPITINFSNATLLPTGTVLSDGQLVRVEAQLVNGQVVTAARIFSVTGIGAPLIGRAEVEGIVSDFVSVASFKINGVTVDGSAALFQRGNAALLKNGARVEAKGNYNGTVLQAGVLKVETVVGGVGGGDDSGKFEVKGPISSFTSQANFTVRNVRINAATAEFKNGTASLLAKDKNVEVKGQMRGEFLVATEVKFD